VESRRRTRLQEDDLYLYNKRKRIYQNMIVSKNNNNIILVRSSTG